MKCIHLTVKDRELGQSAWIGITGPMPDDKGRYTVTLRSNGLQEIIHDHTFYPCRATESIETEMMRVVLQFITDPAFAQQTRWYDLQRWQHTYLGRWIRNIAGLDSYQEHEPLLNGEYIAFEVEEL
jgi:hypothetical protein